MTDFYEFFAGGGMARAGLGRGWTCRFANDLDPKKAAAYRSNYGSSEFHSGDVADVRLDDLSGVADLVWASFPCQDLSLAGGGAGLHGERSGAFHPFWGVVQALIADGRAPKIIALENVCGTLTASGGRDFHALCAAFDEAGYRCGALVIDAALFVPQSRPRLFVIGVSDDLEIDPTLLSSLPIAPFHTRALRSAVQAAPKPIGTELLWWRLPTPASRGKSLADVLEADSACGAWHTTAQTERLLALMSPTNLAKVEAARRRGGRQAGCVYRRTRTDPAGRRAQRAEVRFDEIAGCLRTPSGGSSRQVILVVDGPSVRSRLISARETARLMGLSDDYRLPPNYNDAYHLTGDGVVVDVVRHLAEHLFEPLLARTEAARRAA